MRLKFVYVVIALSLIAGCIAPPEPSREPPLSALEEKGWKIFQREPCYSTCHVATIAKSSASDWNGFIPDLRKTPRRTRDWYVAYFVHPRAVLPNSFMPSIAYLSSEEVDALVAFLQRLNREVKLPKPEPVASDAIPRVGKNFSTYKAGQAIYNTHCVGCHGDAGSGGGIIGHLLSPEPRDFTDAVWMSKQTESYLFSIIREGKPNTAMPGFKDILTAPERALVLRYLEYFADHVAKERVEVGLVGQITEK
jgi:hypothetical protein